jgi:ribosome-binding ATPase YchF (GTP1/OBG family)
LLRIHKNSFRIIVRFIPQLGWTTAIVVLSAMLSSMVSAQAKAPIVNFTDQAEKAGLLSLNVFGGKETKQYIMQDYDVVNFRFNK